MLRMAAAIILAATVLGLAFLGLSRRGPEPEVIATATGEAAQVEAVAEEEVFDPDLLGWQAELGELDLEAEEAGEVL